MVSEPEKIYEIVTQRPEWGLRRHNVFCPFCSSKECCPGTGYETSTHDPHSWTEFTCMDCSQKFVFESKSGQGWYTKEGKVLRGFPNCFEAYVYTCSQCGSDVIRKCLNKSDGAEATSISHQRQPDGSFASSQFYKYECISCKVHVCTEC